MILEVADIYVKPGTQEQFEEALKRGIDEVISQATGFIGYQVKHGIESPQRYLLMIEWQHLEDHTVKFRSSPAFQAWRAIVGPFFSAPPVVEHFQTL